MAAGRHEPQFATLTLVPVVALCIVIVLVLAASCACMKTAAATIEHFPAASAVFTTLKGNVSDWAAKKISPNIDIREIPYTGWDNFLTSVNRNPAELYNGNAYYIADPYDKSRFFSEFNEIAKAPKGYFVAITQLHKGFRMQCSFNFTNKTVGYFDRSDLYFIRSILYGYRTDESTVKLVQMTAKNLKDLPLTLGDGAVDVIITYVIPNNDFHRAIAVQRVGIMGFQTLDWNHIALFYPYTSKEPIKLSRLFLGNNGSAAMVMAREDDTFLPSMRMSILSMYSPANPPQPTTEGFITRLDNSPESADPSYRCYGNLDINIKSLCDSANDVIGRKKRNPTVWDQPCITNTDCPYFQSDKNRGGCLQGGICELPIGVKRVSYRKVIDTGIYAPFCYNCKNPYDTECCRNSRADLAFENDNRNLTLPLS